MLMMSLRESLVKARRLPKSADVLAARCEFLSSEDRNLMEAVVLKHQSSIEIGRLIGVAPRTVRYRVNKLALRMSSQRFVQAVKLLMYLPPRDAELIRLRYMQGESLRHLAACAGVSLHVLRRELDRIEGEMISHSRQLAETKANDRKRAAGKKISEAAQLELSAC